VVVPQTDLTGRTKAFALAIIRLVEGLPRSRAVDIIGRQLLRAETSVAANYRAACRARSRREFVAKMGIVEEEADESEFWLEILSDSDCQIIPESPSCRRKEPTGCYQDIID
jgi:four helix bundle protein